MIGKLSIKYWQVILITAFLYIYVCPSSHYIKWDEGQNQIVFIIKKYNISSCPKNTEDSLTLQQLTFVAY